MSWVKVTFLALVPVEVGLNLICTTWLCPADREKLPPETMAYWVVAMVHVPESVPPPVFLTVKADKVLVCPTVTEPKLTTVVGVTVIIAPPWVGGGVEPLVTTRLTGITTFA